MWQYVSPCHQDMARPRVVDKYTA